MMVMMNGRELSVVVLVMALGGKGPACRRRTGNLDCRAFGADERKQGRRVGR
jgi:hypothetical protein